MFGFLWLKVRVDRKPVSLQPEPGPEVSQALLHGLLLPGHQLPLPLQGLDPPSDTALSCQCLAGAAPQLGTARGSLLENLPLTTDSLHGLKSLSHLHCHPQPNVHRTYSDPGQ